MTNGGAYRRVCYYEHLEFIRTETNGGGDEYKYIAWVPFSKFGAIFDSVDKFLDIV